LKRGSLIFLMNPALRRSAATPKSPKCDLGNRPFTIYKCPGLC
jgi:hypothetical protein